jgi:putative hydroxymethylpyrimidine transport system permease protein
MRVALVLLVLVGGWEAYVGLGGIDELLLPAPSAIAVALVDDHALLWSNFLVTAGEIALGIAAALVLGLGCAIAVHMSQSLRRALYPLLVTSQAIPVPVIAPLLVVWFGYGLGSKIVMTTIIIFFPVASAFQDGLRRTDPGLLDLARMARASRFQTLRLLRIPAALPALASGLRVAAAAAPIGAVVGEWVGASAGLGYVMLHANARSQVDVVFAALLVLGLIAALLWFTVDALLSRLVPWTYERS